MTDTTALPPAGWYPAPDGSTATWWWDGVNWTPPAPEPAAPKVRWVSESFHGIKLKGGRVSFEKTEGPVTGATARLESGADIGRRVTLTRVATIGVFAFGARKMTGHLYLTIDHPEYQIAVELKAKEEKDARKFLALVNTEARRAV